MSKCTEHSRALELQQWLSSNEERLSTPWGVEDVSKDLSTPSFVLAHLGADEQTRYGAKAFIAANPNTPSWTLADLIRDELAHWWTVANALENPRCPIEVLVSHPLTAHLPKCEPISIEY